MTTWLVILTVAVGTYALRASLFVLLGSRAVPGWAEAPMSLVAPAAVATLVAAMVVTADGRAQVMPLPELAAVVVGFLAVRRTGNVVHAFLTGLPVFWVASLVMG